MINPNKRMEFGSLIKNGIALDKTGKPDYMGDLIVSIRNQSWKV
ncbi:MAG: hypothetical protein ACFE94_12480 [Candidatus Hodarchaeota archaeon]